MVPSKRGLFLCALFLCGLEETVLSQRGRCAGTWCFAVFQVPEDFFGAQTNCRDRGGQVFVFENERLLPLLDFLSGDYWVMETRRTIEEDAVGLKNCSSVSVTGKNILFLDKPCGDRLDGFLCQSTFRDTCGRLQVRGDAQVTYTTSLGFEVKDLFPMGTVAVAQSAGAKHPVSKHVCYGKRWLGAPWSCEVMGGGCEHGCSSGTCLCPMGHILHPNNITCTEDPCASCAHKCVNEGGAHRCRCDAGYQLAPDWKSCVDIDECEDDNLCSEEGEVCVNTQGSHECQCKMDFEYEDGECVDLSICMKCEHKCEKVGRVYECVCREGFKVSPDDPTDCEIHCTERDCPASNCVQNPDQEQKDIHQCFCPEGYIQDIRNNTPICTDIDECEVASQCEHKCDNFYGGFRCSCDEGFELYDEYKCRPVEDDGENGSGSGQVFPTPARTRPTAMPSYVKTGSVLGITVLILLCVALLYFVVYNVARRCSKVELYSFKHDMDIFTLQQVTTETYKRLSIDKQFKSDSQRL